MKQVPICHISESVYKTSVNWIGRYPTEALGTFVLWSLDSILDDLNRQHETFKGSKKVTQKSSTKAQVTDPELPIFFAFHQWLFLVTFFNDNILFFVFPIETNVP